MYPLKKTSYNLCLSDRLGKKKWTIKKTDLLNNVSIWNRFSAKFDLQSIISRLGGSVNDADSSISVVEDVDVDVVVWNASDATGDAALACFGGIQVDHALFSDRNDVVNIAWKVTTSHDQKSWQHLFYNNGNQVIVLPCILAPLRTYH